MDQYVWLTRNPGKDALLLLWNENNGMVQRPIFMAFRTPQPRDVIAFWMPQKRSAKLTQCKEVLDRIGEDYKIQYRSMLQARNETSDERYQRLRTDLARLMRELYTRSIREIALDDRARKACERDWNALTKGLETVKPRLFAKLELISVAEEEAFYTTR